jgi:hypothetical protein
MGMEFTIGETRVEALTSETKLYVHSGVHNTKAEECTTPHICSRNI